MSSGLENFSSPSSQVSTPAPMQYQETNETFQNQENNSTGGQSEVTSQWSEMPSSQIPVSVSASSVSSNNNTYNQQRFVPPGVIRSITNFNTHNNQFSNLVSGFRHTNGIRARENTVNGPRLSLPNAGIIHYNNGWVASNARRLLASRPSWNVARPAVRKPKRIRTAFNSQQMMELEQQYAVHKYLDRTRRIELAEQLQLNERTIKIWFQNRRMKEKKDKAEGFMVEASSTTDDELSGRPVVGEDQLMGEVYTGDVYMEQYPVTSPAGMAASVPMSPMVQNPMAGPAYVPEELGPCQEEVHMQMQSYVPPPPYSSHHRLQEIVDMTPPPPTAPAPVTNVNADNWDLTWVKSMDNFDDVKLS